MKEETIRYLNYLKFLPIKINNKFLSFLDQRITSELFFLQLQKEKLEIYSIFTFFKIRKKIALINQQINKQMNVFFINQFIWISNYLITLSLIKSQISFLFLLIKILMITFYLVNLFLMYKTFVFGQDFQKNQPLCQKIYVNLLQKVRKNKYQLVFIINMLQVNQINIISLFIFMSQQFAYLINQILCQQISAN
ncbi:hypothetical protein ABPG72_018612 [Tetrahymena utriculariae]